ncbi:MAG: hypothetical protein AAB425_15835 [Bdellovibrionota bacterium]
MNQPKLSEERRFLHDLANPISSLGLILDILADSIAESAVTPDTKENIQRCQKLVARTRELIAARRAVLIEKEK